MIDTLKAVAIISVLLIHSWPSNPLYPILIYAVPLFLLMMGFNAYGSFKRKFEGGLWLYYLRYFLDKAVRFIIPFLIVAFIYAAYLGQNPILETRHALVGVFRMTQYTLPGPGSYFIPLITQFIVILPLLAHSYLKNPKLTFLFALAVNVVFNLNGQSMNFSYFHSSILQFIFLLVVGFIIHDRFKPPRWNTPFSWIGKASYHIFLFQLIFFTIFPNGGPIVSVLYCSVGGYLFYRLLSTAGKISLLCTR